MKKKILTRWQKAKHRAFPDTVVDWRRIKDFLGFDVIEFRFKNGEVSSSPEEYFDKLFEKI